MTNWLKLETAEAKRDGAISIKNSGRGMIKGDALLDPFTIDYKFSGTSFAVTKSVWAKICSDAQSNNLSMPAIKIILGNEDEKKTRLWLIDDGMFDAMLEAYNEKYATTNQLGLYEGDFKK